MKISVQDWGGNFERLAEDLLARMHEVAEQSYFRVHSLQCWKPAVNVYEAADRFVICAELPGLERDQIDVQFGDGVLQISGVRPKPTLEDLPDDVRVLLMEIDSGPFRRCIEMLTGVQADRIRAFHRRGYLWIYLPRVAAETEHE